MRYLLTINIPFGVNSEGEYCTDPLWAKDLVVHCRVVDELMVCAPLQEAPLPESWVAIPKGSPIRFIALPAANGILQALGAWRKTRRRLAIAMREADVVQLNVAGWPIPIGAIARSTALKQGKLVVTGVESAPWREATGPVARARGAFLEALARKSVRSSDLAFFTHQGYLDSLGSAERADRYRVVPATWIDEEMVLDEATLEARQKERRDSHLKLLFAARLVAAKGTHEVAKLVRGLSAKAGTKISIIGDGPERCALEALAAESPEIVDFLQPVEYGAHFFSLLDRYDAILVPTLSDEQPRIIFDAYARGLPVLASDTVGNREVVRDGETGWLYEKENDKQLLDLVLHLAGQRAELERRGREAIRVARTMTHEHMHETRMALVRKALEGRR